jgi:hypothetical protein
MYVVKKTMMRLSSNHQYIDDLRFVRNRLYDDELVLIEVTDTASGITEINGLWPIVTVEIVSVLM